MTEKRELFFRNWKTGEVDGHVDVTGKPERTVERIEMGMLINKHDDWSVIDSAHDGEQS